MTLALGGGALSDIDVVRSEAGVSQTGHLIIDLDATLITAHSEKEHATPTFKRGYGFHPLLAFVDHGNGGSGERGLKHCDRPHYCHT